MLLTEEEREVLKRVLEKLLAESGKQFTGARLGETLTIREQRELLRKAAEDGQKTAKGS